MGHVDADDVAAGTSWAKSARRQTDNAPKRLQNMLITIVDDDEYARVGLRALIDSLGHRIAAFSSAEEYLASDIGESTSCLILDVHLLRMSGPDLQARLLAGGRCPPTVFVTGRFDEQVRKRVTEAGALGYLTKPCNEKALLNCIGQVDKFVAQQNVMHLRQELETGTNGARRDILIRMLVEEEDKLGLTCEQLDEMDRQIARMQRLVIAQLDIIGTLKAHGQSLEKAERALHNILDILVVHQARRTKIEMALPIGTVPRKRSAM